MGRTARILAGFTVIAGVAPWGPGAGASVGASCPERPVAQTFASFLDPISYFPLPGGDFESGGDDWSFRSGARIEDGNNQTLLDLPGSSGHSHALRLPPGSSARSAAVCVKGAAPVMRFFVRSTGLLGAVTVIVRAADESGDMQVLVSPVVSLLPWWSAPISLFRLPWLGDHLTQVTIEIRSVGLSPVLVDDIYIDPLRQR